MKTLSIKNPWGYLIAAGVKDVENRSWPTKYRGTFLIHASQKWDSRPLNQLFTLDQLMAQKEAILKNILYPTSAIIGHVEIVDCIQNSNSIWAEEGQWHWVLKKPKLFESPILNVKGHLSLWEYHFITPNNNLKS